MTPIAESNKSKVESSKEASVAILNRIPKTARGQRTRAKILKAAEECFGTLGYHQAGVNDITRVAGVALGSFYSYFEGKEEALRELIREMGHNLRLHLARSVAGSADRIEAESRGLRAFLQYIKENPWMYRVLQEAQFVDEAIYREYYEEFGRVYCQVLEQATAAGEIRPGNNQVRNWMLMGISHFLGMRFALWQDDVPLDQVIETLDDLLRHGLASAPDQEAE